MIKSHGLLNSRCIHLYDKLGGFSRSRNEEIYFS